MSEPAKDELSGVFERIVQEYTPGEFIEDWDVDGLFKQVEQIFELGFGPGDVTAEALDRSELAERLQRGRARRLLGARGGARRGSHAQSGAVGAVSQIIDTRRREHLLDMDDCGKASTCAASRRRTPLIEYKNEGFSLFRGPHELDLEGLRPLHLPRRARDRAGRGRDGLRTRSSRSQARTRGLSYSGGGPEHVRALRGRRAGGRGRSPRKATTIRRAARGRDPPRGRPRPHRPQRPCRCGSGKKFKKCHGA